MKNILEKIMPLAYGQYYNLLSLFSSKLTAEKAFRLFATVRKGKILPHQIDYLQLAKYELLPISQHEIQTYRWPGNNDSVLLVHGWESNAFRWRNLIEKLQSKGYDVIAFDAPGHGYSSGKTLYLPLYQEILQFLIEKYKPVTLIGHSVGGMTILYNQYSHPESPIEKIVTIGSPSEFHEIMAQYQHILKFNDRVLCCLDTYVQKRFGFRIQEFSTSDFVRTNTKKGLLLHDKQDNITPYHASFKVHANWKNSQLISTEGLGHSMHQEAVNDQILDFLKS
ncbi:MAG: alpha/beta hydrolase [Maribacter sp.]|nr:alpha/beta hydrolase [Maribacter sp.]